MQANSGRPKQKESGVGSEGKRTETGRLSTVTQVQGNLRLTAESTASVAGYDPTEILAEQPGEPCAHQLIF
jgi:hypothetical protein